MRARLFTAAAVAALTSLVPAAHATTVYARVVVPDLAAAAFAGTFAQGPTCGLAVTSDPTVPPGVEIGVAFAGPTVFSPAGADTVVCSVHVNNATHAGFVSTSVAAFGVAGVAVLSPAQVSYLAAVTDNVYICTEWHHNGGVVYYDGVVKAFAAVPTVPCVLA